MNKIIIYHFYFSMRLSIIATVDEGHHLNVLETIDISCVPQPTAYILQKEQAREKVLINLSNNELFIIRSNLGKTL